nr:RNA-directed DNA polymerase, eukaryota, reverse transcriptase zinc-binding domain protein [Tanacetum cinerariifolium]
MEYPNTITLEQHIDLECDVTKEELKKTVWDCGIDKSPGPDGFTFGFYRRFWSTIENDVFEAVKYFFNSVVIPNGCNSSFIALILKVPDANLVKDFRPISLIGSMHKIIAKILALWVCWVTLSMRCNQLLSRKDKSWMVRLFLMRCYSGHIDLECDVTKEELKKTVWDCGIDKSPGPDGFTFGFYRRFWSTIENDVFEAVKYFFNSVVIPNGCNSSFIALILKVPDANLVKDFRPISLIGSMHKIIAKILALWVCWVTLSMRCNQLLSRKDKSWMVRLFLMRCYSGASGLRINMCKSKIIGILVTDDKVKSAATKLGCLMLNTPFFYLGTKVGGSMSRTHAWDEVIDKDCMLAPKEKGGLGVSSLYALNRALMFKWVWRCYSQNSSLWARVMKAIHGDDGRIGKDIKACNQSCWLNIVNEINVLKNQGINFLDFMRLKLGNGNNISFWNDNWIGGNTLKNLYPRIYALENSKHVTVCAKLADIALDASFRRKPRGGIECIQFNEMLVLMQDVALTPISDRWTWSLEGSGDFSVDSTRKAIDDKRLLVVNSKTRWIKSVPIKVNVHAWKVKLDALPTRFNISRRDSFHVRFLNGGLPLLLKLIPMMNGTLGSCRCGSPPNTNQLILEGVFYVMWWHIWSYRNKLLFDSKIPLKAMIFDEIVSRSFYWCRVLVRSGWSGSGRVKVGSKLKITYPNPTAFEFALAEFGSIRVGQLGSGPLGFGLT